MGHRERTPEQHAKLKLLLDAIDGDGGALDLVVTGFGAEAQFYETPDDVSTTSQNVWEPIDDTDVLLEGGLYWTDTQIEFTGNETNRDYQVRILLNGQQAGEIRSKELKDVDDVIEVSTFAELPLPPGALNIALEAQVSGPSGTMTVTRWRTRVWRKVP